jgi:hypothetical protein
MQQSIVTFIAPLRRRCPKCFGHYYAHHQEHLQTAVAASGFRMNAEVDVFRAVVADHGRYSTCNRKKTTLFSGHYLRNRSTLDIGVLGYIGIL